ncbi:MAG TPA: T9SS type A sorting domain-containing protein [Bacteroidales bacterium]|nr:T9SS type A sorting domain-containing protein [Bacteroidales bacterium]
MQKELESTNCKINTNQLEEGVYIIEINADNKLYRVKIIKQAKS